MNQFTNGRFTTAPQYAIGEVNHYGCDECDWEGCDLCDDESRHYMAHRLLTYLNDRKLMAVDYYSEINGEPVARTWQKKRLYKALWEKINETS